MTISAYAVPGLKRDAEPNMESRIMNVVCLHMKITREELVCRCRKRNFAYSRHLCMYLMNKHTRLTTIAVALLLGKLDHSSVVHGRATISRLLEVDKAVQTDIQYLTKIIVHGNEIENTQKDNLSVRAAEGAGC